MKEKARSGDQYEALIVVLIRSWFKKRFSVRVYVGESLESARKGTL